MTIRNFGAFLRELADYGSAKKVGIWMEVHEKGKADPPVAAAIVRAVDHRNVVVCWNLNPEDVKRGSVKESFQLLKRWIRTVHLHEL